MATATEIFGSTLSHSALAALVLLIVFWTLTWLELRPLSRSRLSSWLNKRTSIDWALDVSGLLIQGVLIPLLQTGVIAPGLALLFPSGSGILRLPSFAVFLISWIGVDYAFYWNHRLLHQAALWPIHQTHHSSVTLDAWTTSRNTLWSSFLLVYLWLNGALIYLSHDGVAVLWAATLQSAMDLWRHSRLELPAWLPPGLRTWLETVLITPTDHAWHHALASPGINFGANFTFWDRLHGTFQRQKALPSQWSATLPESRFLTAFLRPLR